ncbi:EAL domain-containing protein [Luteimonas sp. M1R5S18]|jgi:diguanylate cyclase (GGDEF)-like protein|uniref:EAL domain-containing protein n=1 Tax=Luteimonas rhizosphaericola TaxID=3042024 RepID=A0ABT6JL53_9GAMM|nr:EAL domain-containing protein [Luteimonas rhizosphaericola]MDH5831408.1 EAL domain-containing protein [Luteimonas rhizosphaericola]
MNFGYQEPSGVPLDPVTSLYRLGAGGPSLTAILSAARASRRSVALLHVDIDMLQLVNVNMGEEVGDQVLAAVAQRLRTTMPEEASLWRLSSDEFIACVAYREGEPGGEVLAEQFRDALEDPLSIPPYTLPMTVSIGIAVFPDHGADAAALLAGAERALRESKRAGHNNVGLYSGAPTRPASEAGFADRFVEALEREEMRLYFQPQVAAQDGSLVGVAALLRWDSPNHGMLRPSRFLSRVERAGLSSRLGLWVIDAAMRQLVAWRERGLDYLMLSVHIDSVLLARPDCLDAIGERLHQHQLRAASFEFELPESALALDAHRIHETLTGLRMLGATLTVQDFGKGGLSFAALGQYPLDRLQIGRGFIRNVASDPRSAAIVRGIIAMGHRLNMKLIAKGVETEAELGFLRRNHCDFFLGHLFSPPLPADVLDPLVQRRFLLPSAFAATRPERTLLLLDDEENVLRSLVRLFRRDGYKVLTASSTREAFDLLASNTVQVIVSDQRMPDMSGTEFLAKVRDLYPDTVRMVLSGYTDLATITEAINRGSIYRFLTKPWNDDELRSHIEAAFRSHERLRDDDYSDF